MVRLLLICLLITYSTLISLFSHVPSIVNALGNGLHHRVSPDVYEGTNGMEITSLKLCHIISEFHHWLPDKSYRVPGFVLNDRSAAIFNLTQAEIIDKPYVNSKFLYGWR